MYYFNIELLIALVGGLVATVCPYLLGGLWCGKGMAKYFFVSRSMLLILATVLGGSCVHGAKQAVQTTFTVGLTRETLPLHSSEDGVVQHRSAYYGQIGVGHPNTQYFDVVFDTGSGHVIVPTSLCRTPSCQKHRRYKRKASHTWIDIDHLGNPKIVKPGESRDMLSVAFGTGEVSGVFMREYVCLGSKDERHQGTKTGAMPDRSMMGNSLLQRTIAHSQTASTQDTRTLDEVGLRVKMRAAEIEKAEATLGKGGCTDLSFIYATDMTSEPFESLRFDGIVGLGLAPLSESGSFNLMKVMAETGAWMSTPGHEHIFSVFLGFSEDEPSEITFGGMKPERLAEGSEISYHKVQDPSFGYWQISVDDVRVNGQSIGFCSDGTCRAIWDTGTSLVAVPADIGDELVDSLRYQTFTDSCNGSEVELEFDIAGRMITLSPVDFFRPEFTLDQWWQRREVPAGSETADDQSPVVPPDRGLSLPSGGARYCVPMLMSIMLDAPLSRKTFIFGEPVMQKYHAVFNATPEAPSIGFAKAYHTILQKPREDFLKQG